MKRRDFLKVLGIALVAPAVACRTIEPEPVTLPPGPHFDLDYDRAKRDPVYFAEHVWDGENWPPSDWPAQEYSRPWSFKGARIYPDGPAEPFSAEDFIRAYNGLPK